MDDPQTRYADSHGLSIAYQTMGEGALDIVIAPGLISHVELYHDFPGYTRYLRRLTEFGRVITFDKRGQGLSDALHGTPTLEERMDDLLAVMDAAGSEKAAIFGFSEGGPLAFLLAATHPDRVSHLMTFGAYAKAVSSPAYPFMFEEDVRRRNLEIWLEDWGHGALDPVAGACRRRRDEKNVRPDRALCEHAKRDAQVFRSKFRYRRSRYPARSTHAFSYSAPRG